MILTIRPATAEDARWIGANLREEDEREVRTVTGQSGFEAVSSSLVRSQECYTLRLTTPLGTVEEHPAIIFGLSKIPPDGRAAIWMLGTPSIAHAPLSILREARCWIDHWSLREPVIENLADTRNSLHIRWIQLLGFTLGETYDIGGHPFRHFYKERQ